MSRSNRPALWLILLTVTLLCLFAACVGNSDTPPAETTATPTEAPATEEPTEPATDTTPISTEPETAPVTEPVTEPETYEIYEEAIGNIRVQLYSATVLRVEEADQGTFCDETTLAITNRTAWSGVPVEREERDGKIYLMTPSYTVVVSTDAENIRQVTVETPDGETLWSVLNANDSANVTLPEPADTPMVWSFADSPRMTVPENGFTSVIDEPNNGFTYTQQVADHYIFLCGKDPFTLRADYNALVGPCDMVTVKALGLWFSRYYAYSDEELIRLVADYRRRGYPIDYIVCDTDWKVGGSTGYAVNTTYFPDMEGFLSQMHKRNVQVAFNDHVREYSGSMLSSEQLSWFNQNLTNILEMGLDTWWYDRNWHYALKSPFTGIHGDMLGQMMYLSIMQAYNTPQNRRTVMLSNYYTDMHSRLTLPSYVGTHRYSIQWSGDITPAVLPTELENMVMLGALTSTAYVSSDIGGHLYSPTNGMFIRWTQYGALSPIMRYHSSGADRSPWKYGTVADEVANVYINMRYRLMPLFYTLAYENYADGLPMARRLDFYYPQYEESCRNDQYLLGEDILVAPITEGEQPPPTSWLKAPNGQEGVEISYYNNKDLSGNPVRTEYASTIDFTWGTSAPCSGVGADNFSAIIRTTMTVGDSDIYLGTISDDGVRVYVNDQLVIDFWQASDSSMVTNRNFILKANTSYEIRVEYYEEAGGATLRMLCVPNDIGTSASRTVFIPDGTWMDVFSGETFTGPQTITVTHSLRTSPLFVRLGSLTALAYKSDYADTDQWQRLVLDIYPAAGTSDTSTIYEDDGASLDYQSGASRETEVSLVTEGKTTTVTIGAAAGSYTTEWTEREWTLRVHASDIQTVTVNGESVAFQIIARDSDAAPFAAEGASPDGDVISVTFTAPITTKTVIVIE